MNKLFEFNKDASDVFKVQNKELLFCGVNGMIVHM